MQHPLLAGIGLAVAIASATLAAPANATEADYIDLFSGFWIGSGAVVKDGVPWQVRCVQGQEGSKRLTIEGKCDLSLIHVRIGTNTVFDRASGHYIGSEVGEALIPTKATPGQNRST